MSRTDTVPETIRSRIMRQIRSKDTSPEMQVRRYLHASGFRYRLHVRKLPGSPDLVLPKYKSVVFVHGCFWHQHDSCVHSGIPLSNRDYWEPKLERTKERDADHIRQLEDLGWNVEVIWECEISADTLKALASAIREQ